MMPENPPQLTVPPGFRFHPTDEELLCYYLKKKLCCEAIDLDVIREVDLNKLEPWDLKEKCGVGCGNQNEWYLFSHKDKKYPTGSRTNRATTAGFWKATGRDKGIHNTNSERIGMRKTLVFYTGRAPHGHKTDWIMHEFRLLDHNSDDHLVQDWVVCRVFKKKSVGNIKNSNCYDHQIMQQHQPAAAAAAAASAAAYDDHGYMFDMQLPHLFSTEDHYSSSSANCTHLKQLDSSQNMWNSSLISSTSQLHHPFINTHSSFLNKLLASHQHFSLLSDQLIIPNFLNPTKTLPFPYVDNILKSSK